MSVNHGLVAVDRGVRPQPVRLGVREEVASGSRTGSSPHDASSHLQGLLARPHLPALDGLRAVAVFIVITYHFGFGAVPGDLGVSAFFVLSGFLITWLLLKEFRLAGDISLRRFYTRRVLRIFPAYYVFLAGSYALDIVRHEPWSRSYGLAAFSYLVNYYNATHGHPVTRIAHAWSLGVEEQFYLLWPLLLLLLLRRSQRHTPAIVAAAIGLVAAWRTWLYLGVRVGAAYVYNAFDTRFDNLLVGGLLALCAERGWLEAMARVLGRRPWLPLLTVALILVSREALGGGYHYSVGYDVDAILVAVLIVQMLVLHQRRPWSSLQHPVARYLGAISYPLYLWHALGVDIGLKLDAWGVPIQFAVAMAACVALASASYFAVERPFLRLKRRFEMGVSQRRGSRGGSC